MSLSTPKLGLKKAQDADNAESYLVNDLAGSLDVLDNAATLADTQTLTNKTLTSPTIGGAPAITVGVGGFIAMANASDTAGLGVPLKAGAAPTADGQLAFNTTTHQLVYGSNGSTVPVAASPAFATPVDVGTANATGAAATYVRSDHVHKYEASTLRQQDSANNGRKFGGLAASGTASASAVNPTFSYTGTISFGTTYGNTPVVVADGADSASGYGQATSYNPSTTSFPIYGLVLNSGGTLNYHYHAWG